MNVSEFDVYTTMFCSEEVLAVIFSEIMFRFWNISGTNLRQSVDLTSIGDGFLILGLWS